MNAPLQEAPVTVLLATYNAALYLKDQLASIHRQVYGNWHLLVRDDGSVDGTREVLVDLAEKSDRVDVLDSVSGNLGPSRNFAVLIASAVERRVPYAAFCDQDDIWHPEKLSIQMAVMDRLERQYGADVPILVCSDLEVVSDDLRRIHRSFMVFQGIRDPISTNLPTLVFQNHVVGCTMLANHALLQLANPQPDTVYMHDWWLALCAGSGGILKMLPQPLVQYRQHAANQVGVGGIRRVLNPRQWIKRVSKMNSLFVHSVQQAGALRSRYLERNRELSEAWIDNFLLQTDKLPSQTFQHRLKFLFHYHVKCKNPFLTVLLYLQMAWTPLIRRAKA
jgi:hypothetical protein